MVEDIKSLEPWSHCIDFQQSTNTNTIQAWVFRIREKMSVMIRAEAFNLPNHVNPGDPNAGNALSSGVDLTLTDSLFGKIVNAADPRIMQVAMKFNF
jgi:hypothetical protein